MGDKGGKKDKQKASKQKLRKNEQKMKKKPEANSIKKTFAK